MRSRRQGHHARCARGAATADDDHISPPDSSRPDTEEAVPDREGVRLGVLTLNTTGSSRKHEGEGAGSSRTAIRIRCLPRTEGGRNQRVASDDDLPRRRIQQADAARRHLPRKEYGRHRRDGAARGTCLLG